MKNHVLFLLLLLVPACGGTDGPSDPAGDTGPVDTAAADTAADLTAADAPKDTPNDTPADAPADTPADTPQDTQPADTSVCPEGCPPGYCDEEAGACLWCEEDWDCGSPMKWCKDNTCVETLCVPGKITCLDMWTVGTCAEDGESWGEQGCQPGEVCAAGQCKEVICTPGESTCQDFMVKECDPNGVGWILYPCPPGQGCLTDGCEMIRQNLLVIFDTSGSMASVGFMDTVPCICASCPSQPFPICETPDCPMSKLGLSKYVFNQFFEVPEFANVNLALTHFPMRIKFPPVMSCNDMFAMGRGWYGISMMDSDFMTGDDGSHVTEDGGWFDQYLYEILSVPYPATLGQENMDLAKLWVNFNEEVAPTETPCATNGDCPGGFCNTGDDGKVCWYHTDPELRALSNTPLGRSMFYAGEIYRKQIVIDGKPCETNEDCANANYLCTDEGVCKDPYRHCRTNQILLFTDGEESPETALSDFFNPRVQAKRFRYGLGCDSDEDCFEDATCQNNICKGYDSIAGYPLQTETPWRLETYDGEPIKITTHVIDLSQGSSGSMTNKQIANDGGGTYFHADDMDPQDILDQMKFLIDVKANIYDCLPAYD